MKQDIIGENWDQMFAAFKIMVSNLYREWQAYLWDSLPSNDQAYVNSIVYKTTSEIGDWVFGLKKLSFFLALKSGRRVMILIDEYEAPNNFAFESNFLHDVRPSSFLVIVQDENSDPG